MFTKCKAHALGKLVIKRPAPGTSQECSECGHTHPDNRATQALFVCTGCGFTANADFNAARVIKKRGIESLLSGGIAVKQKKTVKFIKTRAGTPEVMRVDMDCSTISGVVAAAATAQEAIVSHLVGLCLPDAGACESRSSHLNCVSS
ncbi:MAG: zinc ribbon domain-containing protein [Desulfuromonadaceae bacterium]